MSLTEGAVRRRLFELWLPMIGGILAVKAIGVSDAYFIGQLGPDALASISFTFPLVMTLISLAIGLSAGASSVLSRAMGEGASRRRQQSIVTGAIGMAVAVAVLLAIAGFFSIGSVLYLIGASGEELAQAERYMQTWFAGSVFLIIPIAVNGMLRATGDGLSPALLMSLTAVLNIALNPLFIFGAGPIEGFGVQGAAFATVLARAAGMIIALILIFRRSLVVFSLACLREGLGHWREVARVGLPASLSTSLNPVAVSIATAAVATLGSDPVAAFGIASKIQSFALVPLLALSAASPPFVGQNSSAGKTGRSRRALAWCALISIVWAALTALLLYLFAEPVVALFTDDKAVQETAAIYLYIVPLSFAGYGITVSLSAAMNGLGRSGTSLLIGGGRAMLLLAPAAWIGVYVGGFTGVAAGVATANAVSGIVCLVILARHGLQVRGRRRDLDTSECD